jgi:phage repressor protein C with HTH and peptisase S24 domain
VSLAEQLDVIEQGHGTVYKVGPVQPSSRLRPRFIAPPDTAIFRLMPDAPDIETIRYNLQRIMDRKNVKPTTLSQKVGNSKTLVKDLLTKTGDVQFSTLRKLAGALDVELGDLLALPRVPIVGKIGAGGSVIFVALSDDEHVEESETVLRPPGVSGKLVALVVEGSSMLPKYRDGDIIYIQRNHFEGILEGDIGDDCAVRLTTGETYVKQLVRGSEPNRWTLRSLNAPDMENVEVEWATRVLFIMPRRSRELFDQVG